MQQKIFSNGAPLTIILEKRYNRMNQDLCKDEVKFYSNIFQQQYMEGEDLYIDEELNDLKIK
jgi:hypothetical protein